MAVFNEFAFTVQVEHKWYINYWLHFDTGMFVFYDFSTHALCKEPIASIIFPFNSWLSFQRLCRLLWEYITRLEMDQTANSQNAWTDTNYKHTIQRVLEFLKFFPTHDLTQPTKNPFKISTQPNPTQPNRGSTETMDNSVVTSSLLVLHADVTHRSLTSTYCSKGESCIFALRGLDLTVRTTFSLIVISKVFRVLTRYHTISPSASGLK